MVSNPANNCTGTNTASIVMSRKQILWFLIFILATLTGLSVAYVASQQALIRLLKITYNRAELGSQFSFSRIAINIYLNFFNPSLIDVDVDGYDLGVYMNGKLITRLDSTEHGYVAARTTSVLKLVVDVNPMQSLANLFSKEVISGILFDYSKVVVRLKGTVSANHRGIGMKDIPVDISDTLQNLLYGATATT